MRSSSRNRTIQNIKTRFINISTAAVMAFVGMSGGVMPLFLSQKAFAEGSNTVNPINYQGWEVYNDGGQVSFTDDAMQMSTPTGYVQLYRDAAAPVPVEDVNVSYETQRVSGASYAAPSYVLGIDTDNNAATDEIYAWFEPVYNNGGEYDSWNNWTVDQNAQFWSSSAVGTKGGANGANLFTLGDVKAAFPNAKVIDYTINMGSGNDGWSALVDHVVTPEASYDFAAPTPDDTYVNHDTDSTHVDGYNNFDTIQAAVDAVADEGTVHVAAGTYDSFSVNDKYGVTIEGADRDQTTVQPTTLVDSHIAHKYISDMQVSVLVNNSSDITLSNMTVTDNGQTPGGNGPDALVFWNASSGSIDNSTIAANYTIGGAQTGQGIAVDAGDGEGSYLTVSDSSISGFQKNAFDIIDGNGASSDTDSYIEVTVTGSTITGAGLTSTNAQNGIVAWNRGGGQVVLSATGNTFSNFRFDGDNAATAVLVYGGAMVQDFDHNKFANADYFVSNATDDAVYANDNWWGQALGPNADNLDGDVVVNSWCSTEDCSTTLTNQGSGDYHYVELPVNTGADLSGSLNNNVATVPTLTDIFLTDGSAQVLLPAGTQITATGTGNWDGIVHQPQVTTVTLPSVGGQVITIGSAVTVGSDNFQLTFDAPVRLSLLSQGGKNAHVGFVDHTGTYHEIVNVCDINLDPAVQLVGSVQECKYDNGTDIVIWTKHFTTFLAYTVNAPATTSSSSSSSTSSKKTTRTATSTAASALGNSLAESAAEVLGLSSGVSSDSTKNPVPNKAATKNSATTTNSAFLGLGWWWIAVLAVLAFLGLGYRMLGRRADA